MDGRRFDGIARAWEGAADRRRALRSLAALLLTGLGAAAATRMASAQDGLDAPCSSNADCRGRIPGQCVRAHCYRGRCAHAAIRCAAGYHCCGNGRCCEDDIVTPGCLADLDCASTDPCIHSRCETGHCVAMIVDCAPGYVCCGNAECCPAA